jgi:Arc/MetJ family transcription regulator
MNALQIDEQLLHSIQQLSGLKTSQEIVNLALQKLLQYYILETPRFDQNWKQHLRALKGIWEDRQDLEETFEQIREEFERDVGLCQ